MTFPKPKNLAILLCIAITAACSGSGGDSAAPTPTTSSAVKIDAGNAAPIAGAVADAVFAIGGFDDVLLDVGSEVVSRKPAAGKIATGRSKFIGSSHYFSSAPLPGTNRPCVIIGSVDVSSEVANPDTLSAGDRIVREFFDCDDGAGRILNGSYEILVNSFSGDLGQGLFTLNATVTFSGFEVMDGQELTSIVGAATLQLDTSMPPIVSLTVSGDSVTISDNTDSATVAAFRTDLTRSAATAPAAYTSAASGMLSSTLFEGAVTYSTPLTFEGLTGDYPFMGELLVQGESGSSVRLIALDNVNVRLEIDAGDGSGVVTREITWAELGATTPQ